MVVSARLLAVGDTPECLIAILPPTLSGIYVSLDATGGTEASARQIVDDEDDDLVQRRTIVGVSQSDGKAEIIVQHGGEEPSGGNPVDKQTLQRFQRVSGDDIVLFMDGVVAELHGCIFLSIWRT